MKKMRKKRERKKKPEKRRARLIVPPRRVPRRCIFDSRRGRGRGWAVVAPTNGGCANRAGHYEIRRSSAERRLARSSLKTDAASPFRATEHDRRPSKPDKTR